MSKLVRKLAVPRGQWGTVEFAVRTSGALEAHEFLDRLEKKARLKFLALFTQMARVGHIGNPSQFSHEDGPIYGFKYTHRNRLFRIACFRIANRWLLTHGFEKPGAQRGRGRWRQSELDKATAIMKEHIAQERAA